MTYVKIEKTKENLKSLIIRWANMLENLLNQENNIFNIAGLDVRNLRTRLKKTLVHNAA